VLTGADAAAMDAAVGAWLVAQAAAAATGIDLSRLVITADALHCQRARRILAPPRRQLRVHRQTQPTRALRRAGCHPHPIRTPRLATLRNLAIGAIHLHGRRDITETTRWATHAWTAPSNSSD
jgi:hypothetical protein